MKSALTDLQASLADLTLSDQRRLRRRIDRARTLGDAPARAAALAEIAAEVEEARLRVESRRAGVPDLRYPENLPIVAHRDEIITTIRDHQVVIVAGETGSGKTTQLPKMCLELGRGVRGLIGHTQPRRLAARTIAERIAEELATPLGGAVGYQVRFTDQVGEDTLVKLMTDGILLTEIASDRSLYRYDTLIVDEAHERSLNIDFILGYLKRLLPRRPDLKVIITSATIDPGRFSRHFGDAPVIEVSGRTYPVEVRYRPIGDDADPEPDGGSRREARGPRDTREPRNDPRDQTDAICDAVAELSAEGPGDILVFLSGEREIRDTADALGKARLRDTEVLPLYARLSAAEQHRVFQPHTGRRIVLATNVAETSLTVPGIRYVVDPGTARISRYSRRLKVQRLPIEPVSQASADQRKGRCGRVAEGICIRLYDESDFLARPEYTEPEILRTNLASVILQMAALGLGDVAAFGFIDPPDRRNIADGVRLLQELGALDAAAMASADGDAHRALTPLGRKLARLPVDPRLGRMVLAAERLGCVREVIVIVAALSIQDPRERPADAQQAAAEQHARFADPDSDFLAYLNLFGYLRARQKELSSSQFRRMCRTEYLNYLRVREWQDIYGQLRQVVGGLGIALSSAPDDRRGIHCALLAGLLSHIGLRDGQRQEYQGARNARFAISPGSALFKASPQWVMAAELVETSRLWARVVARIEPEWIEEPARHLVKREYGEPHWDAERGSVVAYEKVTLYGLPIIGSRQVNYGRIDPALSRELFIRHALVEGDWETRHRFFHDNRKLLDEVEELEHRARRRDIMVDDETLFDFYDRRVGRDVVSARHFDAWWKKSSRSRPDLLDFDRSMLIKPGAAAAGEADYPDAWRVEDVALPLVYRFEPGAATDGVSVRVPLPVLARIRGDDFAWHVPGLREELVTALIRSLPKPLRRNFVPAPEYAKAALDRMGMPAGSAPSAGGTPSAGGERLLDALERALRDLTGVSVPRDAWQPDRVPEHLKINFSVIDEADRVLAEGKDLAELKGRLREQMRATLSTAAEGVERQGLRAWTFGPLPRTVTTRRGGYLVTAYPAVVDTGDSVAIRVFETEAGQQRAMWPGTRRLLLLNLPSPVKLINARLPIAAKLELSRNPHRNAADLLDDCVAAAVDALLAEAGGPAWDADGFARLREYIRPRLAGTALATVTGVRDVLAAAHRVNQRLADLDERGAARGGHPLAAARADLREQLSGLVYRGFVTATGPHRLPDVARYLRAIEYRLDKATGDPQRDRDRMLRVDQVRERYRELLAAVPPDGAAGRTLGEVRWMIEELRVGVFAQALGTAYPVSEKRIFRLLDQL